MPQPGIEPGPPAWQASILPRNLTTDASFKVKISGFLWSLYLQYHERQKIWKQITGVGSVRYALENSNVLFPHNEKNKFTGSGIRKVVYIALFVASCVNP